MLSEEEVSSLRRLMELRERKDELESAGTKAKKAYQEAEAELFEKLDSGPVARLNNVDLGEPWGKVSFGRRETYYGRIIKGKEDEALAYFERHGELGALTKPQFVKKRINEIARQHMESGEKFPDGLDWYASRGVTITRQKS